MHDFLFYRRWAFSFDVNAGTDDPDLVALGIGTHLGNFYIAKWQTL